ncbi:hypothetical protein V496_09480 [Pseudogymnoascus sp. VKM F-4515 (FW-2607)]|nr:hypothetical protein V496_09480 [Pseudogymnoascus sp. VKM F-4515 (FW-2607)]KFY92590.1 hypothetical protein V498_04852 [Pseudogymnoascus sp. VKM F-4517 (FW-2822)]
MDNAMDASQNPTKGPSPPTPQDSNKPCSATDKLRIPPKSPNPLRRLVRNLAAELAPDKGFPETDFFSSFSEDGLRHSARARKPVVRMAHKLASPPPKPAKTKRPKRPRAAASMPPATTASYTDTGQDKASEEVNTGPSPGDISVPDLPIALCDRCNDSPDGRNTWYVGPYGLFGIGQLRFPQPRKSATYVRGDICAETWASAEDAEAAGAKLDLEMEDGDDEAVRAGFDVEIGNEEAVSAGTELYSMMGPEDDETIDEEDGEGGEELEEAEEVDLEELIKEWREFCVIGQKAGWGPWLSCFERPAHIDRKKWNERSRRRADALNAKHEAKLAANRARTSL